jgi:hypothetical protein
METRRLSEAELFESYVPPMRNISSLAISHTGSPGLAGGVLNIWPYVAAVPEEDLQGHGVRPEFVDYVFRSADGRWDLVHVATDTNNVHLVVVVDVPAGRVRGHHLLDLNAKYGVEPRRRPAEPAPAPGRPRD